MADVLTGSVVGFLVEKLLDKVLHASAVALQHHKHYQALHTLLSRLHPLASEICAMASASSTVSPAIHHWLQQLQSELEEADAILQIRDTVNLMRKIAMSKKLLKVTHNIKILVQESALLGLLSVQSAQRSIEASQAGCMQDLNVQIISLQEYLRSLELSLTTRQALQTPTCNFGYGVNTTTVDRAFSEIKQSADAFMSMTGPDTSHPPALTHAVISAPKLRRQDSETVFGAVKVVEAVQELLLSEGEDRRYWVGVWATGGAGKTLTAQRVFNSPAVQNHFTGGCFWLTVGRSLSEKMPLVALSQECTGAAAPMSLTSEDIKNRLCQQLGGTKKALLVLDDVWYSEHLDWLSVLPTTEVSGNKIFVTTRNVEILERKHAAKMQIPMLPAEDSWKLFCWHAFRGVAPVHLEILARKVVDECKGLPLALKVIGAAFAGKLDLRYWQRSLEKLKNAEIISKEHEQQLFLRLELSLEDLPNVHPCLKDCFLYFAAFPEDAKVKVVEDLLDIWIGEGIVGSNASTFNDPEDEAYELLGWLIARSLIELNTSNIKSHMEQMFMTCKIHDVLRDLARYTLQHKLDPPKRDCLYESGRQLATLPRDWITSSQTPLAARRLSLSFNNLRALPDELPAPHLQVLLLRDNPFVNFPKRLLDCFKVLRVLDLRNTNIKELPTTVGQLKLLITLNLNNCGDLEKIPDSLGNVKGLQRLHLSNCKMLPRLPCTLSRLSTLQILNLSSSAKVWDDTGSLLSNIFSSSKLGLKDVSLYTELAHLSICSFTQSALPISFKLFHKLQCLRLQFRQLLELPDIIGLENLQALNLEGCWCLQSLPSSITSITSLTTIKLVSCRTLSTLPALDLLPQLQVLDLSDCQNLKELPSSCTSFGSFPELRELTMYACEKIASFPPLEDGAMPQLALLSLSGWTQLASLPESLKVLKCLKSLDASLCINLKSLGSSLDLCCLSSLEELHISRTRSLSSLPTALASLPNLKLLDLRKCSADVPNELLQREVQGQLKISR